MMATFLRCAMVTHWLLHTPIQIIIFVLFWSLKILVCLISLSIQTRVLVETFQLTLIYTS